MSRSLIIYADGGSRGNPGVAGYGAVVLDAVTDALLAERAEPLGVASNNVAEYSGLIAGLRAAAEIDPGAQVEARLDSKLVVEQMAGRWKIKHEDMRRLALEARDLARAIAGAGGSVTYVWVPREENTLADRLSNVAMDGESVARDQWREPASASSVASDEPDAGLPGLDDEVLPEPDEPLELALEFDVLPAHTALGGAGSQAGPAPDPSDHRSYSLGVHITPGDAFRPDTLAVRAGLMRSGFDETAEALYLTSGFVYASAEEAEAAFKDEVEKFIYSRYGNPTVAMFEDRMRAIEGAEACFATSSGMAAVFVALAALCGAGSRVVASRALFGSCFVIVDEILPRWGVETVLVDGSDLGQWEAALDRPTDAVFFETPSNPMQELVDIAEVSRLAHAVGAQVVVDNVFGTPVFSRPLEHGADIVVYSTTKHIDGGGRVLGGAVLGPKEFIEGPVKNLMRHTGPSMSPFNAWVNLKGLETLRLRVEQQARSTLALATFLESHPRVVDVRYPWLASHPQHELARRQMLGGGTVVTFTIDGGKPEAFAMMNAFELIDISNNLGDAKSMTTHPATTTHRRLTPEARAAAGIADGTVRISVGLEDTADLLADVERALEVEVA